MYCPVGNKCLKIMRGAEVEKLNWSQAVDYCRSQPGLMSDLASISNADEQDDH